MENFLDANKYFGDATAFRRSIKEEDFCSYGLDFLDDKLGGIHPTEFVVVGAASGAGKTSLVEDIAVHNAIRGKRVAFFRLEGDMYEFPDSFKWKYIYKEVMRLGKDRFIGLANFNYQSYRLNRTRGIDILEDRAEEYYKEHLKSLYLFDNSTELNKENLSNLMTKIYQDVDLFVIDHLHFFDMFSNQNENSQITEIMKTINIITKTARKPVILVSHLRKKSSSDIIVPDKEDFMGSSNVYKIAHTCIMLAPDYDNWDDIKGRCPTFFRIAKSRTGVPETMIAMKIFDSKRKRYEDGYRLGRVKNFGKSVEYN